MILKNSKFFPLLVCVLLASCGQKEGDTSKSNVVEDTAVSVTTVSATTVSATPAPEAPVTQIRELKDIDGFWVAEKYLTTLTNSKNPFTGSPESIAINTTDKKINWTNFHEGYWRNINEYWLDNNDSYFLKVSEPESSNVEYEVARFSIDGEALVFHEGRIVQQLNERFVKIPFELPKYANKLILSGKYKDEAGKFYEFTDESKAIWPKSVFNYELVLDSTESDCTYIDTDLKDAAGERKRIGYKWESEILHIFEIVEVDNAPISCAKQPYLKLVKR